VLHRTGTYAQKAQHTQTCELGPSVRKHAKALGKGAIVVRQQSARVHTHALQGARHASLALGYVQKLNRLLATGQPSANGQSRAEGLKSSRAEQGRLEGRQA